MSRADDGLGQLEDAVGERRLAVVDVRDDREVADTALFHPAGDGTGACRLAAAAGRAEARPRTPTQGGVAFPPPSRSTLAIDRTR